MIGLTVHKDIMRQNESCMLKKAKAGLEMASKNGELKCCMLLSIDVVIQPENEIKYKTRVQQCMII